MKPSIAILGAGRMGAALAKALVCAGYPITVWNRSAEKIAPLTDAGAKAAPTVLEAIKAATIVIINVTDYAVSESLLHGNHEASMFKGKLFVQLSSGTPAGAREAALWFTSRGASYLDGAIMATPDFIGSENATILMSGSSQAFQVQREVFSTLGGSVQYVGEDYGLANALDSALLALMWGALFGTLHAIAVCQAEGIDLTLLAQQREGTSAVLDGLIDDLIQRTSAGRFASDEKTLSTISPHHSSLQHLLHLMETRHLDQAVIAGYNRVFQRAIEAGREHDDFAALSLFMSQSRDQ